MNDTVRIIAGKDKGKQGKILQILRDEGLVVVDGVNKMYKYARAQKAGDKGQRIEFWGPLPASNMMLICPKCGKQTRVGMTISGDKKARRCTQCKTTIE